MSPRFGRLLAPLAAFVLCSCAALHEKDPWENVNRAVFQFNDHIDNAALKPAARAYRTLPDFVQTGVGNFFGNLEDVWTSANNFMQGKFEDGLSDVMRVTFNTFLGLGGVLDIASEAGLPKHKEDFGQTLGGWGVRAGPYVVLPLLGPSTLRDALAVPIDWNASPWAYVEPVRIRNPGYVINTVSQRAALLDATQLLEDAALDRYQFVRDGYLQRRESKLRDGDTRPPSYDEE